MDNKKSVKHKKHIISGTLTRITALILTAVLLVFCFAPAQLVPRAARKNEGVKLTLSTAKSLAVAQSTKIEALDLSIEAKKAAKTSAEKALKVKMKNITSFRWSPLLNFKLPSKPNEQQSFEFQYKPVKLQKEIEVLEHKKEDQKLAEYEKVSKCFVTIVKCEELIDFYTLRRQQMQDGIAKLRARIKLGTATKGDVAKAETKLKQIEAKLTSSKTKFESQKTKLSNLIGLNVKNGYSFENPFVSAEIGRSALPFILDYTLERDESLYEAKNEEGLSLLALNTNQALMQSFYGSSVMSTINTTINKVKTGGSMDKRQFKKDYDAFLKKVDEPWNGSYKIWFISFPKEWLKGSLDGVRYVEDEPYVLYENAIDYQSARKDLESTKQDVTDTVNEGFETYVESRTAYLTAVDSLHNAEQALLEGDIKFMIGEINEEEYKDLENAVNDATVAEEEALASYSETTYSYDRQTCGAVSAYLAQQNIAMTAETHNMGEGVNAADGKQKASDLLKTLVPVFEDGIIYSIDTVGDGTIFELRVDVPEGFSVANVNYYELWVDNIQVGTRTPVNKEMRHPTLATNDVTKCEIRFYTTASGKAGYLSNAEFNPSETRGNLQFIKGYNVFTENGLVIGFYDVKYDTKTGTVEVKLDLNDDYGIAKYAIKSGNDYKNTPVALSGGTSGKLYLKDNTAGKYSAMGSSYSYLDAIGGDLEDLTIEFSDESGTVLFEAMFISADQSIVVPRTQLEYIMDWQTSN